MPKWQNWSGRLNASPQRFQPIYSEAAAAALAREAKASQLSLRVVGAGHSHKDLVPTEGIIADLQGLSGVISSDPDSSSAWVWGGSRIYSLGAALHGHGLALPNQGDIDQQSITGATATGTHGTGKELGNLSSRVVGARIALASGELVDCSAEQEPELWQASRLHLGAFGLITRLKLALQPIYRLEERTWQEPLEQLLQNLQQHVNENRHCEFFWYPQGDTAQVKVINTTDKPARYPIGSEGERCGFSHEVLPNHRPHRHTEMEYSVAAEDGPACMRDIAKLLREKFPEVRWPVEYRTLAADDVWMSTAYQRPTVTISVHQGVDAPDEPYFRACEEIFLAYQGLPHWGKVNYLSGAQLAAGHAKWQDWWAVRDQVDPTEVFLNPYLSGVKQSR